MSRQLISVQDAELDVNVWGSGEPIVFVQTALTADELRPLASAPALEHGYRKIFTIAVDTPTAASSTVPVRSRETPRIAVPCSLLWPSTGHTSWECLTVQRLPCGWLQTRRRASRRWWFRNRRHCNTERAGVPCRQ